MDIDPKTYPSRVFVRFTAHNQLMADASGQTITMAVQRLGGNTYLQEAIPDGESPSLTTDSGGFAGGFSIGLAVNPTGAEDTAYSDKNEGQDPKSGGEPSALGYGDESPTCGIDETLFEEIIQNTFKPNRYPELYQSSGTQKAAMEIEVGIAAEIVAAYRKIKQKQDCAIVQSLNRLL